MQYAIVIEKAQDGSYSAFVPDLPGCVACGDDLSEVRNNIREAIILHIESLKAHGEPVPPSTSIAETIRAA